MIKTLKDKISLVYLCLVVCIAIVGSVSVYSLFRLSDAIHGLMTNNYKSLNAVSNMVEALERQDSAILIYINMDRQKGIDLFGDSSYTFQKWFNIEINNITESGEREHVNKINEYYKDYIKGFSELQEIRNTQGLNNAIEFYNNKIMHNFDNLKHEMYNLSLLNEKSLFMGKDKATENANNSKNVILLLSTLTVFSGFLLSRFFVNRFLSPIYTLTKSIQLVKAGDLNQQIFIKSKDEIGDLSREFNEMTRRLQQFEQSTLGNLILEKNKTLAIVKSISDPLIVLDTNYKIILLNDACEKFFEIEEQNVVNRHFLEAIRNGELFDHISSVMETKAEYGDRIIYLEADGDYYYNVVVTTIKNDSMDVIGLIVAFQNVTQLKKLEKVKTEFVATISHEFKTPLTSIMMGTSMILDESLGTLNEEQRSVMNTIKDDETRLSTLVNELLELSKLESDRAIFNIAPCNIEDIIKASVKQFSDKANDKGIALFYLVETKLPLVVADFEKITWVINNLITNALKYTFEGNEISINAYVDQERMKISVKDTGVGIPSEFLDKVFDKFVQLKGYHAESTGTGLGLAIVKEIVKAHKGEIWCNSELGAGSTFTFTLPLVEENKK